MSEEQGVAIQQGVKDYITTIQQATVDLAGVISKNLTVTPETIEMLAATPEGREAIAGMVGKNQMLANAIIDHTDMVGEFGADMINGAIKGVSEIEVTQSDFTISGVCAEIEETKATLDAAIVILLELLRELLL